MSNAEKLEGFVDLATCPTEAGYYWDPAENMGRSLDYFDNELGFLNTSDRRDLLQTWHAACDDGLKLAEMFGFVKYLQLKY